jgi:UDP-perosamine 4-acetyltransferase
MSRLVLVGTGGHAKVVLEVFRAMGGLDVVGFVDPDPPAPIVLGLPVIGGDEMLHDLRAQGVESAFVVLGNNRLHQRVGAHLQATGFAPHHHSPVSSDFTFGTDWVGAVVIARSMVGTEAIIDELAILNTGAVIDHDNRLCIAAHVAPGCALADNVKVGERALVAGGSDVLPGIAIGARGRRCWVGRRS